MVDSVWMFTTAGRTLWATTTTGVDNPFGFAIPDDNSNAMSGMFIGTNASGTAVGLPPGQMGSSEVGHLTIGSGRVLFQDLMRVNKAIEDGSFLRNAALVSADGAVVEGHARVKRQR